MRIHVGYFIVKILRMFRHAVTVLKGVLECCPRLFGAARSQQNFFDKRTLNCCK